MLFPASTELSHFYSWGGFLVCLGVTTLVVFLPGLVVGIAAGFRRSTLAAFAPAASVGISAVSGIMAREVGWGWNALMLLPLTAVISVILVLYRAVARPYKNISRAGSKSFLAPVICILLFAAFTVRFALAIQSPGTFSQTWDTVFHLNTTELILSTDSASSLHVDLTGDGKEHFYPAAWHGIVALVTQLTGTLTPVATNAAAAVVSFLVWPVGIYALVGRVTSSTGTKTCAMVLALLFPQFPLAFLWWGNLYPNLLGYALLPIGMTLFDRVLERFSKVTPIYLVALLVTAAGMALAQPVSVITFAIMAIAWLIVKFWSQTRRKLRTVPVALGAAVVLFAALIFCIDSVNQLSTMRTGTTTWYRQGHALRGLFQLVVFTGGKPQGNWDVYTLPQMIVPALAILAGVLVAISMKRAWPLLGAHFMAAVLFVCAFCLDGDTRLYWTGLWYCDVPRVFAPLCVGAPIFAALALQAGCHLFRRRATSGVSTAAALVVLLAATLFSPAITSAFTAISHTNSLRGIYSQGGLLDSDELQLFSRLDKHVPPGQKILANPWEGGSLTWPYGKRMPFFPRITGGLTDTYKLLVNDLDKADQIPEVCSLLKRENIHYALQLRDVYLWGGSGWNIEKNFSSLDHLEDIPGAKVVDQQGEAKLVKLPDCTIQ